MKKTKTMRTGKPARQSARPTVAPTFWQRLAQFPERFRENRKEVRARWDKESEERAAETWEQSIRRQIRELRAALRNPPEPIEDSHSKRFWTWFHDRAHGGRAFIYFHHVTDLVEVSKSELLKATAGAPFRLDFGRNDIIFMKVDFENWIRAQARQAKAVGA